MATIGESCVARHAGNDDAAVATAPTITVDVTKPSGMANGEPSRRKLDSTACSSASQNVCSSDSDIACAPYLSESCSTSPPVP